MTENRRILIICAFVVIGVIGLVALINEFNHDDSAAKVASTAPLTIPTDDPTDPPTEKPTKAPSDGEPPMVGESGTLGDGAQGLACAETRDGLHKMLDALNAHDDAGYREAIGDGAILKSGERVQVIAREGFAGLDMKIRLPDGRACWTEADVQNLFQ